jgi:hypothetical protein
MSEEQNAYKEIAEISRGDRDAEIAAAQSAPAPDMPWMHEKGPMIDALLDETNPDMFTVLIIPIVGGGVKGWKKNINKKFTEGATLLHSAAAFPNPKLVKFLLDNGADATAKDVYGNTPAPHGTSAEANEVRTLLSAKGGRRRKTRSRKIRNRRTLRRKQ